MNNNDSHKNILDQFRNHVIPAIWDGVKVDKCVEFDVPALMVQMLQLFNETTANQCGSFWRNNLIKEIFTAELKPFINRSVAIYDRLMSIGADTKRVNYNDLDCNAWAYPQLEKQDKWEKKNNCKDVITQWAHECQNMCIGYRMTQLFVGSTGMNISMEVHLVNRHSRENGYCTSKDIVDNWADINNPGYNTIITTVHSDNDRNAESVYYNTIIGFQTAICNIESLECALDENHYDLDDHQLMSKEDQIDQLQEKIFTLQDQLDNLTKDV